MKGIVISLCDITGVAAKPWVDAGYSAILVDPQHPEGVTVEGRVTKVGRVIDHPETWAVLHAAIATGKVRFVHGFPPCTDLAASGNRWKADKLAANPKYQFEAMQVVWQCHVISELAQCPYFVENPIGQVSSFWRKPDHIFQPWWYTGFCENDHYKKKTCLWTGGGFRMPKPFMANFDTEPDERIYRAGKGPERENFRSATPSGFARAVFFANLHKQERKLNTALDKTLRTDQHSSSLSSANSPSHP